METLSPFAFVTLVTLISGAGGTGLGGFIGALFKSESNRTISLLLAFAGGVMTAMVCFDLLAEAEEAASQIAEHGVVLVIFAVALGVAMQLTNILRDVGEDWNAGRVYLPAAVMEEAGLVREDLAARRVNAAFRTAWERVARRSCTCPCRTTSCGWTVTAGCPRSRRCSCTGASWTRCGPTATAALSGAAR